MSIKFRKEEEKRLLLCHNASKKQVCIPRSLLVSDVEYLEDLCRKLFPFQTGDSVSIQRFNEDFDEYVDLDANSCVEDLEKLRVIIGSLSSWFPPQGWESFPNECPSPKVSVE